MAGTWSHDEVAAVVDDYFAMLDLDLRGRPYSKAEHYGALAPRLPGRTKGSIELKHGNISAVLRDLRHPWIFGYKPFGNYQHLLFDVVDRRVKTDTQLAEVVKALVATPAVVPDVPDMLRRRENPPEARKTRADTASSRPRILRHVDYFAREAQNASLGRAGEEFVLAFERARLRQLGRADLAERVEHVSAVQGDGAGFDIQSFERDARDRLIEVKTTSFAKATPFFVSRNEVAVSRLRAKEFHLYRVFQFRVDARLYILSGSLEGTCRLDPWQFEARVK